MKRLFMIVVFLLMQKTFGVFAQEISISNVKQKADALEIEIILRNNSPKDILLVAPNPEQETSYFIVPESKTKTLRIRRHFFLYPAYVLDVSEPCFGLIKVKAGESYRETLSLKYPITKTYFLTNTDIDLRTFDSISFRIGVLPYDDFIYK